MKWFAWAVGAAMVIVLLCWGTVLTAMQQPINVTEPRLYDVAAGASITSIASDFSGADILPLPAWVFRLYARLTRSSAGTIKAGEYELLPGMTSLDMLDHMRRGMVVKREITFPEGWTFSQWRSHLATFPTIRQTLSEAGPSDIMEMLGATRRNPEGLFFPDTYQYVKGEADFSILKRAHRRMRDALDTAWRSRTPSPVLPTARDALILASIVEKETGLETDRSAIAGVFVNRLKRGMRLQSDPTVIYGLPDFDGDLTRANLARATPYNTYVIRGLPPTPICNPGLASLNAVLNPDIHDYYYFVARGDGSSEFSATLEAHNAAVARFQKGGRVQNYRSSP